MRRLVAAAVAVSLAGVLGACQDDKTVPSPAASVPSSEPTTATDMPRTPGVGMVHEMNGVLKDPLLGHRVVVDQWAVWTPEPQWVADHRGFDGSTVVLVHVTIGTVTGDYYTGVYPTSFRLAADSQDIAEDILAGDTGTVVRDQLPQEFALLPTAGAGRDRAAQGWLVFNIRSAKQGAPYTLVLERPEMPIMGSEDEVIEADVFTLVLQN
ncbi:MAG: hypothetical protein FWF02_04700 [Micrococcales bacterium]|nr:hypothetical protein [Micrococcales bacterium]MCL2666991.1 hypothetical protein [Micrococcales bacterium]